MVKEVNLPDGSVGEFPDDMPDEAIAAVLRRQYAPKAKGEEAPPLATGIVDFMKGAKSTFDRTSLGVKGLLPQGIQDLGDRADKSLGLGGLTRDNAVKQPDNWQGTAGAITGDVALSAAPVARLAGLSRLPLAMRTFGRAAPIVGDVAANAGYAALTAPEDRGTSAALGGAGAVGGRVLVRALGALARPAGRLSKEVQTLFDANINPTFGQVMGGAAGKLEEFAKNIPGVGGMIVRRQQEAQAAFQKATRLAALPPGAPREAVESVDKLGKAFNDAYESSLSNAAMPESARSFDALNVVRSVADDHPVTEGQIAQVERIVSNAFKTGIDDTAASAHRIESMLKAKAAGYGASGDQAQRDVAGLLRDVANEWGQTWRGGLPQATRDAVSAIDGQYAQFVPVRRAAAKGSATTIDEVTPAGMLQSIRQGDRTPNKTRFIAGGLPQQELSTAAQNVLGSSVKQGSDVGRMVMGGGAVAGAALAPKAIAGYLLAAGYSTDVVQRYLTGQLAPHVQRGIDEALRSAIAQAGAAQVGRATATNQGAQ